jgi:hypothetical protein
MAITPLISEKPRVPKPPTAAERVAYYKTQMHPLLDKGKPQFKRHWEFLKEADKVDKAFYSGLGVMNITVVSGIGYLIGHKVGGFIGGKVSDSPEGSNNGSSICGTIGGGVGAVLGVFFHMHQMEKESPSFQQWHKEKKEDLIEFSTFLKYAEDLFLKEFVCQLTQNVMTGPARIPTGYLVDYDFVASMKKDYQGQIECPFTKVKFSFNAVKKDLERALLINKRALKLIQEDIQAAQGDPSVLALLKNMETFVGQSIEECYNNCLFDIETYRIAKIIDFPESQRRREDFVSVFGNTARHELDFSLKWKEILDERWKQMNPGDKVY